MKIFKVFAKKLSKPRAWKIAALATVALLVLFANQVKAQSTGNAGGVISGVVVGSVLGPIFYGINYTLATIASAFVSIEAWFIQIVLQMSNNIVNTDLVQVGESVALSIANLFFVLGIIVIAIATILHWESYGIKSVLWKLVVAAIMVNFSLVIGGAIINFFNILTNYFMAPLSNAVGSIGSGPADFASNIAAVFQPQTFLMTATSTTSGANLTLAASGANLGGSLALIGSVLFSFAVLVMIVVILGGFLVMLLIRYLFLAALLILAPLAWLTLAFPGLSSNFGKWWHNFLKWNYFAPIVVFFMYLAIKTGEMMNASAQSPGSPLYNINTDISGGGTGIAAAFQNFFGSALVQIVPNALHAFVIGGLMVAGLIAANGLGITFANATKSAAYGAAKWVGGYVGARAKQYATAPLRTKAGQRFIEGISKAPVPGFGYAARGLQRLGVYGGAGLVEAERKKAEGAMRDLTPEQIARILPTLPTPQQFVALERLKNSGDTNLLDAERWWGDSEEAKFNRFGEKKLFDDLGKRSPGASQSKDSAEAAVKARAAGDVVKLADAAKKMDAAAEGILRTMNRSDVSKAELNDILSGKAVFGMSKEASKEYAERLARAFARVAPHFITSVIPGLKSAALKNFTDPKDGWYMKELKDLLTAGTIDQAEFDKREKMLLDSMSAAVLSASAGGGTTTPPTPPTPP